MFEICSLYLESLMKMFHYYLFDLLIDCSSLFHLIERKRNKERKRETKKDTFD